MKKHVWLIAALSFLTVPTLCRADADTRTVQAEFDRCESTMERVKRDMLRFEEAVERLKRMFDGSKSAVVPETMQSFLKLENRVDYLRGRIDRSAGQRDKIRGDLKAVSGATCPSCITSSVNLYCRNGETLTREIEECLANASTLEDQIGRPDRQHTASTFSAKRTAIAATMKKQKPLLDSCATGAGAALWKQCGINLMRADSLNGAGAAEEGNNALDLVNVLMDKAIKKCGGK